MKYSKESTERALLEQLVAIDSVNPVYGGPGEAGVFRFVQAWLDARGIAWRSQEALPGRCNLMARIGPADAPALLLEAHMDTVGVEGWGKGDPFALRAEGGRLYGRGACDTKGSLVCFMKTLEHFHEHPEQLKHGLVFAATVDEESEQIGAYELARLKDELGLRWAITGEPTLGSVISRHKGVGRYCLEVRGKAAHGSTPELGDNAIYKAARLCRELEALAADLGERPREREIERGTLNVGFIKGGIGFNIVPDRCGVDVDRRFGSKERPEDARAELEAICRSVPGARLETFLERPALRGDGSSAFVAELLQAARRAGVDAQEREVPYMTNAVAYEEVGIEAVVFGPGDIAQAHKNDEYIEEGEIERSVRCLIELIANRTGSRSGRGALKTN